MTDSNESIIIKGDFSKQNILAFSFLGAAVIALIIAVVLGNDMHYDESFVATYIAPSSGEGSAVCFYAFVLLLIVGFFCIIRMNFCEITVTSTRIYGKSAFGKRVDLPVDMISSIGSGIPKGISIATSSGLIKFWLLNNRQEVYRAITDLLQNRQQKSNPTIAPANGSMGDLRELKALLDQGVITQEEFDAKKKQLLGL